MKIAICGTRGIPACYGGFETFAEELGKRLVKRGHSVVVYGRRHVINYAERFYEGVEIRLLPAPRHKYFETPVHSLLSFLHLLGNRVDVVLLCNAANSPFAWMVRLGRIPLIINVDGIERMRAKWNILGRWWYRFGEICSVAFANRLIADADMISNYYKENYKRDSLVIRYGCLPLDQPKASYKLSGDAPSLAKLLNKSLFTELGIEPLRYVLYVSRLEPENNANIVVEAYNRLSARAKERAALVVVGDAPYAKEYIDSVKRLAGPGVIFAGGRYGADYQTLQSGAALYVQATEVGGTHPALVEAMGFGNCVVANTTPEHVEVLGEAGLFYRKNDVSDLCGIMERLLLDQTQLTKYRNMAYSRALGQFDWEKITNQYEELFCEVVC